MIEKMNKYANKYKYLPIMLVFITANFQPLPLAGINISASESGVYSDSLVAQNNILTLNAVKTKKNERKTMNV